MVGNRSIEIRGLAKVFGRRPAVDGLSLSVEPGQTFGFLGPNGAGKSTTIRMMLGLVAPTAGEVYLHGFCARTDRLKALSSVGAMVEVPAFYQFLSGRENVRLFGKLSRNLSDSDVDQALDMVGMLGRARDKVKAYSHGMKQRLGIAVALVSKPDLVILDEPTNGLDPEGVREVRQLIRRLAQDLNMTVFLSSHLLNEVQQTCSHVGIISQGRLVAQGAVSDLLNTAGAPVEFTVDRPDAAAKALKEGGAEIAWASDSVVAVNTAPEQVAELNTRLVSLGFQVSGIQRRQASLEDIYLGLLSHEGKEPS